MHPKPTPERVKPVGEGFDASGNVEYDFRKAPELEKLRDAIRFLQCFNEDVHLVGKNPPRYSEVETAGFILDTAENRQKFLIIATEIDDIKDRLAALELPAEKIIENEDEESA